MPTSSLALSVRYLSRMTWKIL